MKFNELIKKRYSCRSFDSQKPISRGDLNLILNDALLSPSACNSQPWHFSVATGQAAKEVAKCCASMGMNKFAVDAPCLIVISEGMYRLTAKIGSMMKEQDYKSIDIGIATAHLCLSATELGIDSCIMGWFDEKSIKKTLGIKTRIRLVVALGYADKTTAGEKSRKTFADCVSFIEQSTS